MKTPIILNMVFRFYVIAMQNWQMPIAYTAIMFLSLSLFVHFAFNSVKNSELPVCMKYAV